MSDSPLRSRAQHTMLTRAASDADYAKRRGIDQGVAQSLLEQHVTCGEPDLPERAQADTSGGARTSSKPKTYKFLGS